MRRAPDGFDIKSFLQKGAIFGSGEVVWLFWGNLSQSKIRPLKPSLLVCDFFLENEFEWWSFTHTLQIKRSEVADLFKEQSFNIQWEKTSRETFDKQYEKVQAWLNNKELKKAVPYVMTQSSIQVQPQHIESFISSAAKKSQGYLYGAWCDGKGLIGLSPELLVSQNKKEMKTMALAGTCSVVQFEKNPEQFLNNQKEIKEHQLVVDDLLSQLIDFENVHVSKRGIERTPKIVHFKTEISWTLTSDIDFNQFVYHLHPTPALGCSPRKKVFEYMKELDAIEKRGRFGAPFGFSESLEKAEVVVAIRNLSWDQEFLQMGTGCGVVCESQKESEWEEVLSKKKSIQEIFNLS